MREYCPQGFVIDNEILFAIEDCSVLRLTTGEKVTLKKMAALCLLLLLSKHNTVVTQNELLTFAWGEASRNVSFNAFYQCILSLRKSFSILGIDKQIITTIPRKGLIIQNNINIVPVDNIMSFYEGSSKVTNELPGSIIKDPGVSISKNKNYSLSYFNVFYFALTLGSGILILSMLLYIPWDRSEKYFSAYQYMGKLKNNCQYYFNTNTHGHDRHELFLAIHHEYCPAGKYVYITAYENAKNISVFICSNPADLTQKDICNSVYYPEFPED